MIEFASPTWLSLPAAIGLLGVWALWRGQRVKRAVSSLHLWRGLDNARSPRRRIVDPLWLMVLLAGLLAGICVAGPNWVAGTVPPSVLPVDWSVRSIAGVTEAWVRLPDAAGPAELSVNGTPQTLPVADLRQGTLLDVSRQATAGTLRMELSISNSRAPGRAGARFERAADTAPFGLIEIPAHDLPIDAALQRLFILQRGARPGDPSLKPRVVLLNLPQPAAEDLAADLLIAQPATALPGVSIGTPLSAPDAAGWMPEVTPDPAFPWPPFVALKGVHVHTLRPATLSSDWHILATAGGKPWLAWRETRSPDAPRTTWLWLASDPATQTDWPRTPDAGFVLFFAEFQHRALESTASPYIDWIATPEIPAAAAPAPTPLHSYLGVASIVLLIAASAWFIARGRTA